MGFGLSAIVEKGDIRLDVGFTRLESERFCEYATAVGIRGIASKAVQARDASLL